MDDQPEHKAASDTERLDALEARLAEHRARSVGQSSGAENFHQANQAWRMVTELVAGLIIGFGIGYGLDYLFGTLPILMVVFTLLGLAAGIRTMMRTAQEVADMPGNRSGVNEGNGDSGQ